MGASGDTLWTGFGRFTDMCGLKLEQLENAFHPCVHPSLNIHSSQLSPSSHPLTWAGCQGLRPQHSILHVHHIPLLGTVRPHNIKLLFLSIIKESPNLYYCRAAMISYNFKCIFQPLHKLIAAMFTLTQNNQSVQYYPFCLSSMLCLSHSTCCTLSAHSDACVSKA